MSIMQNIKSLKKAIKLLREQVAKEQDSFAKYRSAVEKYKELCKHDATSQELTDALMDVSDAWHQHTLTKSLNDVNHNSRSS